MKTIDSTISLSMMDRISWIVPIGLIATVWTWAYWATLIDLVGEWRENQDYSVGQLVPFVAIYLVWNRRADFRCCRIAPCWWGLALIFAGIFLRFFGLLFVFQSAERYSMLITLAGLVMLLAGRDVFFRLRWIFVFLLLMVPLPGQVHNAISFPLQSKATAGAVFFLELFGISVVREGNVIWLNHQTSIAVAEACSGLRMLSAFIVVAATLALVANRPRWQKFILVFSSIPIAIGCNLFRLCVCSVLFLHFSSEVAEKVFHDFAGLIMMPMAVLILLFELQLMNKFIVPEKVENPSSLGLHKNKNVADSRPRRRRRGNKK